MKQNCRLLKERCTALSPEGPIPPIRSNIKFKFLVCKLNSNERQWDITGIIFSSSFHPKTSASAPPSPRWILGTHKPLFPYEYIKRERWPRRRVRCIRAQRCDIYRKVHATRWTQRLERVDGGKFINLSYREFYKTWEFTFLYFYYFNQF